LPAPQPGHGNKPRWEFDHHRLDAFAVAKQAMVLGMAITRKLPRAEAGEAAGILESLVDLRVADEDEVEVVIGLGWRLCATLCRLAELKRR
jgi:hypothetical protein